MKATIIVSLIGVLGFNEQGQIIEKILFEKDPKYIAKKLNSFDTGKTFDEVGNPHDWIFSYRNCGFEAS